MQVSILRLTFPSALHERAFDHSIKVHENLLTYLAILTLAKDISAEYRHFWRIPTSDHLASSLISTLEFLGISEEKFLEIRSTMIEDIELNTPDSE